MKAGRSFHNQRNLGGGRVFDSLGGGGYCHFLVDMKTGLSSNV